MTLAPKQIFQNAFVVTIDEERYAAFLAAFEAASFPALPRKFVGYEIEDKYLLDNFKILSDLKNYPMIGYLEENLKLIHSLNNNASHFAIVQHAMLLDLPFVVIFEDDAVPVSGCTQKIESYCSNVPDDIDVLRLGYLPDQAAQLDGYVPPEIVLENFIVHRFSGSHAYIVFKKFYKRFLEENKAFPRCDYGKINPTPDKVVYALKESLFNQRNILNRPVIHSYKLENGRIKLPIVPSRSANKASSNSLICQ